MTLDRAIALLLGAGFGARALDSKKSVLARVGYALVGYDLLKSGLSAGNGEQSLFGPAGAQATGLAKGTKTKLKFEERRVKTIAERVAYVHEQMVKGTRDPEVYALARAVLTRKCGETWCLAEKDYDGEMRAMFEEARSRCRYTMDPLDYDAFQTPRKTLELAAGDCDDENSLLGALLRSVGINVRSRIVQMTGNDTWNHIYLMAQNPTTSEWRALDLAAIGKPAFWEVPKQSIIRHRDFDVLEKEVPKLQSLLNGA